MNYKKATLLLIVISLFLRIFFGSILEFGNDEVYYWLYAKYPALSHFDHPPMVGFFIQFFTLNLFFENELFIRLAAILPATLNMYLLYLIAKNLKNEKAGFLTVLLYNISIYGFLISGIFILPDAPMLMFCFLGFYYFLKSLPYEPSQKTQKYFLAGVFFLSLALYSKYQAVYFLAGGFLYIVFFNRIWLKKKIVYLSILLPLFFVGLIFYWNYQNDFISFTFHRGRVSLFSLNFRWDSFLREVFGQILYNNPYIIFFMLMAFWAYKKKKWFLDTKIMALFLFCALPLIITVLYLSLYRDTLPHWSGVSYLILLPLLGVFLAEKKTASKNLKIAFFAVVCLLFLALGMIKKGWFLPDNFTSDKTKFGRYDFTMDLYGWEQAGEKIKNYFKENPPLKKLQIVNNKWFPAAHLDFYIAKKIDKKIYALGNLKDIHKYFWINKKQMPLKKEVLYITDSKNYNAPKAMYFEKFNAHKLLKTFPIKRNGKVVKYVFLYKLFLKF